MTLYDMLDKMEIRPGMYFARPGFASLEAFIHGYELALMVHDLDEREEPPFQQFNEFVLVTLGRRPRLTTWQLAIPAAAPEDREAFELFFRLLHQFRGELPPAQSAAMRA